MPFYLECKYIQFDVNVTNPPEVHTFYARFIHPMQIGVALRMWADNPELEFFDEEVGRICAERAKMVTGCPTIGVF